MVFYSTTQHLQVHMHKLGLTASKQLTFTQARNFGSRAVQYYPSVKRCSIQATTLTASGITSGQSQAAITLHTAQLMAHSSSCSLTCHQVQELGDQTVKSSSTK